jgi:hypothetical protein
MVFAIWRKAEKGPWHPRLIRAESYDEAVHEYMTERGFKRTDPQFSALALIVSQVNDVVEVTVRPKHEYELSISPHMDLRADGDDF